MKSSGRTSPTASTSTTSPSGFTTTQRAGLQAFKVIPVIVYRVYADGRPDELIRGADIVGTPLASFAKIIATSDKPEVFNGYCGAESGSVPVSAVSPAILISEIEIEKKDSGQDLLPLPAFAAEGSRSIERCRKASPVLHRIRRRFLMPPRSPTLFSTPCGPS